MIVDVANIALLEIKSKRALPKRHCTLCVYAKVEFYP